ncbi:unnamed protein product [Vicia faba]|uniref:Uncharacterized protein n=1 Tax=Vicia faba TaxID=3906 RepID=A0AAV0ZM69_VICFA|nr:unnamed protein product [Vicia faba]
MPSMTIQTSYARPFTSKDRASYQINVLPPYYIDDGEPRTKNVDDSETPYVPPKNIFIIQEMGKEHVIEEEYMSNEIDNGVDDDNYDEMPSVIRFNEEYALIKDFTFKGLEWSFLH